MEVILGLAVLSGLAGLVTVLWVAAVLASDTPE